jgi:hypothetical protein
MKIETIIVLITGFFVLNTYYEGKLIQNTKSFIASYKKYYEIAFYCFLGLCFYLLIRKNPNQGKNMLMQASNLVKFAPVDKDAMNMLTPIFNLTTGAQAITAFGSSPQEKRMLNSGGNSNKRSVSETKKKWVASQQNWSCAKCSTQLQAHFEVDHKIRLEHGGTNHVDNLEALCRNCHGEKTSIENL